MFDFCYCIQKYTEVIGSRFFHTITRNISLTFQRSAYPSSIAILTTIYVA